MTVDRRQLLSAAGLAVAGSAAAAASGPGAPQDASAPLLVPQVPIDPWGAVRSQFLLSPANIDMSAMLIASHPKPVRDAIERHRRELDVNTVLYLEANNRRLQNAARAAAARYLGVDTAQVALTDSTTMGAALVYHGLRLNYGDEIITTDQDYYVTHETLRLAARRSGAKVRRIALFKDVAFATESEMVDRIVQAVTPRTRLVALTWVHSSTGLKIPAARIAQALSEINAGRPETGQILFGLDAVHGFGAQDVTFADLGCDFFFAGCHKWLFGPRGTGVIAAGPRGWAALTPTIPSFIDPQSWSAWMSGGEPGGATGARMTPGGFKAFEHVWALEPAFGFHDALGKARVAARTSELAGLLKDGLTQIPGVRLKTPRAASLSAGIVSFDVDGLPAETVVARLRERRIIASVAPYATTHVRLTPSIRNSPDEIDTVLREVSGVAAA